MFMKKNFKKITAALGAVAFGVAATATVANADTLYTVQSGDTLSSISQKFANDNSLVQTLAQQNNIQDINKIYVGQQLVVKTDGQATDAQTTAQPAAQATTQSAAAQTSQTTSNYTSTAYGSEADAKAWIAAHESGNNYGARNGQYIGKYQLSAAYLNGDYSPANQERVADQYVAGRYGSWTNAKQHWLSNGWY
ncbi:MULTISPECIES: LysM peptidoglycan-binding domain-containing protein [Limosilactobacillus]|uniref:LysM domain-containing protein n=2 Tax=Limosilactobacillus TaxID=2742598 RepID=A0AAJ1M7K0_LIMMU|nr:LysM domain-containing protein [Limosilactobacillus mucosae]MCI1489896.1 LysM domain-containing protein [Limosilactobacillus mucosae]MCI1526650.1 LysM domain-containing protein [Limosilactobacillus mucosae]MCI6053373.1 LysM domain-containing protein [Limosilactobacillus mucosae]MDC2828162.1 LysM domain-containing protein [Limosilactobacillus mucosae]MDC2835827.1 LysM domain-containing protein [Limosilactobacillus mucosae]